MKLIKVFILFISIVIPSKAANSIELVRDVELEEFTREILTPLTDASNLDKNRIDLYFVKSNQVNAFVTSGQNIFINTELIIKSENYDEYLGVLAHELAHINGGHVSRTIEEIATLGDKSLPIYLLGVLGILRGDADFGLGALLVGSASVQDGYLYYSRTQEAAADQAAVSLLCKSSQPVKGLENFLEVLNRSSSKDEKIFQYKSTHPLTADRANWIRASYSKYPNCNNERNTEIQNRFELIKAKLFAYTHSKEETISIFNNKTNSSSKYGMAALRLYEGNYDLSLKLMNELLTIDQNNPYYYEMLGEIYFHKKLFPLAVAAQEKVIELMPLENDLHLMMLGSYLLADNSNKSLKKGIKALNKSLFLNSKNSYSWHLLAKAYSQNKELALAQYASAERYYLRGDNTLALSFLKKAIKNIDNNTVEWYRASDLIQLIIEQEKRSNKN